jgi:hypothetical protein
MAVHLASVLFEFHSNWSHKIYQLHKREAMYTPFFRNKKLTAQFHPRYNKCCLDVAVIWKQRNLKINVFFIGDLKGNIVKVYSSDRSRGSSVSIVSDCRLDKRVVVEIAASNPAWGMDVCLLCLYVVLSCVDRDLCYGLITRPEESYRVSLYVWSQKHR